MAAPADIYAVASGQPIYGGMAAPAGLPAWVSALPLWQWYEIPNTALSSVEPATAQTAALKRLNGPKAKIEAWCGATLRRQGSVYMLGAAGGHADYAGNETDALVLNTANPAWVELRAPSLAADIYNLVSVYGDNRKAAQHTYWATQYDQINDRMLILSAGGMNDSGIPAAPANYPYPSGSPAISMAFQYGGVNDWLPPDTLPVMPYTLKNGDLCCADSATGEIFINSSATNGGPGVMYKRDPATGTWASVGSWYASDFYAGSAINPNTKQMLVVGGFSPTQAPRVRSTVNAASVPVTFGGLGPDALVTGHVYPGAVWDEANGNFLVFANTSGGSINVLRVSADYVVDQPTISGSIANRPGGVCNAVQYVPELKGVVIANSYTGNVKFMRTAL